MISHSIANMDPGHSMYILSSHQQAFSAAAEPALGSSSRILQHSSGNIGLESSTIVAKSEDDDSKEAPSIFESRTRSSDRDRIKRNTRRTRRLRAYPWETDLEFIRNRYELRSERYNNYRAKANQSSDQVWPEELEVCFQYGKIFYDPCRALGDMLTSRKRYGKSVL